MLFSCFEKGCYENIFLPVCFELHCGFEKCHGCHSNTSSISFPDNELQNERVTFDCFKYIQ